MGAMPDLHAVTELDLAAATRSLDWAGPAVPPGHAARTGYVAIHDVICYAPVGHQLLPAEVERAYRRQLDFGDQQRWPPPTGYWRRDHRFVLTDGAIASSRASCSASSTSSSRGSCRAEGRVPAGGRVRPHPWVGCGPTSLKARHAPTGECAGGAAVRRPSRCAVRYRAPMPSRTTVDALRRPEDETGGDSRTFAILGTPAPELEHLVDDLARAFEGAGFAAVRGGEGSAASVVLNLVEPDDP